MGKAVDTSLSIAAPLIVGKVFVVPEAPQALRLAETKATGIFGARGTIPVEPNIFGTHKGIDSGRDFFPNEIGIPIRDLAGKGARITPRGIAVVEKHLSRVLGILCK